jgi:hypothetical protein
MARKTTPQVRSSQATLDKLAADLREQAETDLATHYPQYRKHWNGWRVVEVTRRVPTKLGLAFEAGELVLCSPDTHTEKVAPSRRSLLPYEQWQDVEFVTCYSRRNTCDTMIRATYIREVLVDSQPWRQS